MAAQEQRRDLGRQLANIEARLKELHADMQNISKGDEKYLHLCTEEHKVGVFTMKSLFVNFSACP